MRRLFPAFCLLLALGLPLPVVSAQEADAGTPERPAQRFQNVLIVVLENTDYDDALKQPFLSLLARRGALLTNLKAEAHPSQPNYIALVSGSTQGVRSDRNVDLAAPHIGDLLEAKGLDWKVYAEGFPGNCFLGARQGNYVRKHVPFLSFLDVQMDARRCARIVDMSDLAGDIARHRLPAYALVVPDLINDGHNSSVAFADRWLQANLGSLIDDPRARKDLLLVVTCDEDERLLFFPSSNHVATLVFGDAVMPGSTFSQPASHYSLLRLVESEFQLPRLGVNDAQAPEITGIWK